MDPGLEINSGIFHEQLEEKGLEGCEHEVILSWKYSISIQCMYVMNHCPVLPNYAN